ncbi:MAG TPA: hypothetical protein VN912_03280, partial [Candidatus Angelobacter sp.]|nr:hypothetical protein [Candidatus Angelobacter sp.]
MARGIPRLAAHGWALGLAVLVLLLAPLAFKHSIAEAHANAGSPSVALTRQGDSALRYPATAAQVGAPLSSAHHQVGVLDGLVAPGDNGVDLL